MKDKNNLDASDYITSVSNCVWSKYNTIEHNCTKRIVITDGIKDLHIQYKGKEYVFDIEKTLKLLCKELEK